MKYLLEIFKKEEYIPSPKSHSYGGKIWNLVQFSLIFFSNLLSGENKQQRNLPKTHHLKKDKSSYCGLSCLKKVDKLFWTYVALNTLKPYSQKTSQSNHTRTTALSNSMKLSHARGTTQDGHVMVERSDRMSGEGNGKPLQYSCLENPMNSMKRQNDSILKEKLPRSVGALYATGDQWRNNSRKNEGIEPKQKEYPAVDVTVI